MPSGRGHECSGRLPPLGKDAEQLFQRVFPQGPDAVLVDGPHAQGQGEGQDVLRGPFHRDRFGPVPAHPFFRLPLQPGRFLGGKEAAAFVRGDDAQASTDL